MCGSRDPNPEALVGALSLPKASKGTQTTPPPIPPRLIHRGVDTQDLVRGMRGLTVATQTYPEMAGKEEWAVCGGGGSRRYKGEPGQHSGGVGK